MSRLETRVQKLEAMRKTSVGAFVWFGHGDDEEMRRREFIEKHGHEPEHLIVVEFV